MINEYERQGFFEHKTMDFSANHSVQVGDVIRSTDEQIAIADTYEIWEVDKKNSLQGSFKTVGEATIRILSGANNVICTNIDTTRGLVCFLPKEFKGYGILAVRITRIHNKSVEAIPIDYLVNVNPLEWYCHGSTATTLLQEKTDYPNLTRIRKE